MIKYVRCMRNETYFRDDPAQNFAPDLVVGDVYRVLPVSPVEAEHNFLRVIDRSGVGSLYPNDYFEVLAEEELVNTPAVVTVHMNLRDKIELRTLADRRSEQAQETISMSHLVREWVAEHLDLASD